MNRSRFVPIILILIIGIGFFLLYRQHQVRLRRTQSAPRLSIQPAEKGSGIAACTRR